MNIERMLKLADELERSEKPMGLTFDMSLFISGRGDGKVGETCGTAACIGGMACLMFGEPGTEIEEAPARQLLDLDRKQAERLFFNSKDYIACKLFEEISRQDAAAAIRRMVEEEGVKDDA